MPEIDTLDPASLDRFRADLVEAGFESTNGGRSWVGATHPAFGGLTTAEKMVIVINDGWPWAHPSLLVPGLKPGPHLQRDAVCLWFTGDRSLVWLRFAGFEARIEEWVANYKGGIVDDPGMDPERYYDGQAAGLFLLDLAGVTVRDGQSSDLRARRDGALVRTGPAGSAAVRVYMRDAVAVSPTDWAAFKAILTADQRRDLDARMRNAGRRNHLNFVVLLWNTAAGINALAIEISSGGGTKAMEVARTDADARLLRAGPDAAALQSKSVVIFGAGAIGSHVADLLGRSGVGRFLICDSDVLRPGDLVRHAGLEAGLGLIKGEAVRGRVAQSAPWATVQFRPATWAPKAIRHAMSGMDVAVDATGEGSFIDHASRIAETEEIPLVSVALFRHGSVARVRIQTPSGTHPIYIRTGVTGFPEIRDATDFDPLVWEPGCGAPVNNAPPISVATAAAFAARAAVDALAGRAIEQDIVHVLDPIDPPFDRLGISTFP